MADFVTVKDVTFGYGRRVILDDVTLHFGQGQVVAIMGGSGMGKTTLLKLIGGLETPDRGSILIDGEPLDTSDKDKLYAQRRRMGMLFQFGALFTDMSVLDNVAFPLREQTDLSEELIVRMALMKLNAVGLRGAADLMPSEISGGMSRRVALARAIALDPELIMYDEPFAGLDPISMGVTARLIRDLNDALALSLRTMCRKLLQLLITFIWFLPAESPRRERLRNCLLRRIRTFGSLLTVRRTARWRFIILPTPSVKSLECACHECIDGFGSVDTGADPTCRTPGLVFHSAL